MASLGEAQKDTLYCQRPNIPIDALDKEKSASKSRCPNGHPLKGIRAVLYVQVECDNCDGVIAWNAFGPRSNENGRKRIIGCKSCNYHLCRNCYDQDQAGMRI